MSIRRNIMIIRCTEINPIVQKLHYALSQALPLTPIIYVIDAIVEPVARSNGAEAIEMTAPELDRLGLYHGDARTGWICGDYAYYMALQHEWQYAWLIEPDVYVNERAYACIQEVDQSRADFLTTDFHKAESSWSWKSRLEAIAESVQVHACFFPLTRASRRLVIECLRFRQTMTQTLQSRPELWTPNDESVMATVAASQFEVVDLQKLYPRTFRYWRWGKSMKAQDLYHASEPTIAHPVHFQS